MSRIMEEDIKNILSADIQWEKLKSAAVLVTGASGMLGTYMLRTLAALNDSEHYDMKLYGLVRHPEKMPADLKKRVSLREDPAGTIAANTLGTYYTLELARKSNAKGYLFISSREIYGQPYEGQREFTEDTYGFVDPLEPRSCYPEGKKAAETMCSCFRQQYGMNTKIARLAHTFGPGMSIDDGRVQADFLRNVIRNEDIVLKSEGLAVRTYTYVSDAVAALFYILLNSQELVYNIASEESTVSIRELAQTLVDAYPERNLKLVFDLPKADENTGCAPFTLGILNSDKIRKLGWKPSYTLKEGLMRTVAYLEE